MPNLLQNLRPLWTLQEIPSCCPLIARILPKNISQEWYPLCGNFIIHLKGWDTFTTSRHNRDEKNAHPAKTWSSSFPSEQNLEIYPFIFLGFPWTLIFLSHLSLVMSCTLSMLHTFCVSQTLEGNQLDSNSLILSNQQLCLMEKSPAFDALHLGQHETCWIATGERRWM